MIGKNFGSNNNWETDFYFSGVTAKVWVKFGYKGKSKTLEVIPSLEEKLNLFSNAGEIKFAGLTAVAKKEQKADDGTFKKTKTLGPYTIVKKYTLLGDKYYLNLEQNEN
ncbi:hypothetical protein [Tenacibaculum sp. SDUM215027]|uniref:hypothetical protein n=1 Tax=Tenacibaculum sp. SDUM215027 TaxID=3422596 RepID=UPI003D323FF2